MLEITYKSGRGHVQLNLDALLPCNASDFKRILSFVDLSNNPAYNANLLFEYISGRIEKLKKQRSNYSDSREDERKEVSKLNGIIKKYLAHSESLTKKYGTPELSDGDAEIIMHKSIVYAVGMFGGHNASVKEFDGWTFEKSGYTFDVRKNDLCKASYIIMLHGTGLKIAESSTKSGSVAEITSKIINLLNSKPEQIEKAEKDFNDLMIAAGFIEQRRENISNDGDTRKEVKSMSHISFTSTTVTYDGKVFPAEYSITTTGSVLVFAITGLDSRGHKIKSRMRYDRNSVDYSAALSAAIDSGCKYICKVTNSEKEREPKAARGPIPEKTFIGQTIVGNGWRIFFDGELSRTRVIISGEPTPVVKALVEESGFYYSGKMNSWNKKLTFKAYRAAQKLAIELNKIYGDAA